MAIAVLDDEDSNILAGLIRRRPVHAMAAARRMEPRPPPGTLQADAGATPVL